MWQQAHIGVGDSVGKARKLKGNVIHGNAMVEMIHQYGFEEFDLFGDLRRGEVRWVRVVEDIASGIVEGGPGRIVRIGRYLKFVIEASFPGYLVLRHKAGDGGLPGRIPDGLIEVGAGPSPAENARRFS